MHNAGAKHRRHSVFQSAANSGSSKQATTTETRSSLSASDIHVAALLKCIKQLQRETGHIFIKKSLIGSRLKKIAPQCVFRDVLGMALLAGVLQTFARGNGEESIRTVAKPHHNNQRTDATTIDDNYCDLCSFTFKGKRFHHEKYSARHIQLAQAQNISDRNWCEVCDCAVHINNRQEHERGGSHRKNALTASTKDPPIPKPSATTVIPAARNGPNSNAQKVPFCDACNRPFTNGFSEHARSISHRQATMKANEYWCVHCSCVVGEGNRASHEGGSRHQSKAPTQKVMHEQLPPLSHRVEALPTATLEFRKPVYSSIYLIVTLKANHKQSVPMDRFRDQSGRLMLFGPYRTRKEVSSAFVASAPGFVSLEESSSSAVATSNPLPYFPLSKQVVSTATLEEGSKPRLSKPHYVIALPPYPVPDVLMEKVGSSKLGAELQRFELNKAALSFLKTVWSESSDKLPEEALRARMHALVFVEEAEETNALHRYDIDNAAFEAHDQDHRLVVLPVAGLAEKRPSVLRGDSVVAITAQTNRRYLGYVHYVRLDNVCISFGPNFRVQSFEARTVEFTIMRSDFRIIHRSIDNTSMFLDGRLSSPFPSFQDRVSLPLALHDLNIEQLQFVDRFVQKDAPRLQILWGPPGTGKTTTVVALVECLVALPPKQSSSLTSSLMTYVKSLVVEQERPLGQGFVFICTPSNAASDLIVERLSKRLSPEQMIRIVAPGRLRRDVPESIRAYTTPEGPDNQGHEIPDRSRLEKSAVIVVTLGTAGRLYACHPWLKHRISHLIVDEAGQATDALLCAALQFCKESVTRRILLAGDPKQLGPVVQSVAAKFFGLNRSPLTRLLTIPSVSENCVFQLVENYRSHPDILQLVNCFYDDKLISPPHQRGKWTSSSSIGPRIVLVHSRSPESVEPDSPSVMNLGEINCVMSRVVHLLETVQALARDIVIISPYLKQAQKINQKIHWLVNRQNNQRYDGLRAVTVEAFQGQEAKHIIITCVRSVENDDEVIAADINRYLGFLKQESRVNVAISRAIDTLTIIGNFSLLVRDESWKKIISRAIEMNVPIVNATADTQPFTFSAEPAAPFLHQSVFSARVHDEDDGDASGRFANDGDEAAIVRLED